MIKYGEVVKSNNVIEFPELLKIKKAQEEKSNLGVNVNDSGCCNDQCEIGITPTSEDK